jgi:hypothetical protein
MTEIPQYSECDKIREELKPFRQALMVNLSSQAFLFPNGVVSYEGLDAGGELWLTMSKPRFHTAYLEPMIPVDLCFYKKEADYFVKISGTALMLGINEAGQLQMRVRPSRIEHVGDTRPKILLQLENWVMELVQKVKSLLHWKSEHSFGSSKREHSFGPSFLPEQTI